LASIVRSRRGIESLESRILLSDLAASSSLNLVGPLPVAAAQIAPSAVASARGASQFRATDAVTAAGSHYVVTVLSPDADGTLGISGAADTHRLVNLGDLAGLRAPNDAEAAAIDFGKGGAQDGNAAPVGGVEPGSLGASSNRGDGSTAVDLPDASHVQVDGTFDPVGSSMTLQVPLHAATQAVRVAIWPSPSSASADEPALGQLSVTDSHGRVLAEVDPDASSDTMVPNDVTIAMQNAPDGGHLVVRLRGVPGELAGDGLACSSEAPANLSVVVDVQRQDQSFADTSAEASSVAGGLGALPATTSGEPSNSGQPPASESVAPPLDDSHPSQQLTVINQSQSASTDPGGGADNGFCVRAAAGPLVSRSAGPLGPILAANSVEQAPAVDRHERALLQDIAALDTGSGPAGSDKLATTTDTPVAPVERDAFLPSGRQYIEIVTGAGGFPQKVTATSRGERGRLDGLLAALPSAEVSAASTRSTIESVGFFDDRELGSIAQLNLPSDREKETDYLRAACGIMLGLGLTAGPLFADLAGLVRPKRTPSQSAEGGTAPLDSSPVTN
jgi:hypothetical protein